MMAGDWKDCANNDIEMCKAANKAKISDYIVNVIITVNTIAVLFYSMGIVLTNVDITNRTIEIPHIYKMEIPFDITTQVTYKFALIMEVIQLIMSCVGIGIMNALLLTLVSCMYNITKRNTTNNFTESRCNIFLRKSEI